MKVGYEYERSRYNCRLKEIFDWDISCYESPRCDFWHITPKIDVDEL